MARTHPETTYVYIDLPDLGWVPAGVLKMDVQSERIHSCTFDYGRRYAERPEAISLDPLNMPLPVPGVSASTIDLLVNGDFAGGIRDASPDGYGRSVLARAAGRNALNEFQYLVASGSHRVGALAFGPTPTSGPERTRYWPDTTDLSEELDLDALYRGHLSAEREDFLSESFLRYVDRAGSLGGARPKAAVTLDGRQWLAKFPKKGDTYDAIRAEWAVMRMAKEAGFDTPDVRLERIGDQHVFLIERFDRVPGAENGRGGTPFVSAMSLTGETEATARYGSYEAVSQALRRFGVSAGRDMADLHRRALFNVLVGNDDDHLRNHGFLYDHARSGWRLSPLYDVSPRPMLSSRRSLAISLLAGREMRDATVENVVSTAETFGLSKDAAEAEAAELAGFVSANWERLMREAGMSPQETERMAPCFAQADASPPSACRF